MSCRKIQNLNLKKLQQNWVKSSTVDPPHLFSFSSLYGGDEKGWVEVNHSNFVNGCS